MFILDGSLSKSKEKTKPVSDKFNRSNLKLSIEVLSFLYRKNQLVKAEELSEKFSLSKRTVRRLISDLREVGYNITSTMGPYGGYKLDRSSIILPVSLTSEQQQAYQSIENTIKGSDLANKEATLKLLDIIGLQSQLNSHITTDVYLTKKLSAKVKRKIENVYDTLLLAIKNKQRVKIKYKSLDKADNNLEYKEFRPQQFQVFNNVMYIKGYYNTNRASFRTLRLSRFVEIHLIDKKYSFNENFDIDNQKSAFSKAVYKLYLVKLKIAKDNHDLLDYEYGKNQTIIEKADHYILEFELAGDLLIKELVLSMGVYCEILEPKFIRDDIKRDISKLNHQYSKA